MLGSLQVLSSAHFGVKSKGTLLSSNVEAKQLGAALGRDMLRLPARAVQLLWPDCGLAAVPMVVGGDFNAGTDGKRPQLKQKAAGLIEQPA